MPRRTSTASSCSPAAEACTWRESPSGSRLWADVERRAQNQDLVGNLVDVQPDSGQWLFHLALELVDRKGPGVLWVLDAGDIRREQHTISISRDSELDSIIRHSLSPILTNLTGF